jgi:hypothetical protein
MPLMIRYPKEIKAGSVCSSSSGALPPKIDRNVRPCMYVGVVMPAKSKNVGAISTLQTMSLQTPILGGNAPLDEISWLIIGTGCVMMQNTKRTHTTKCAIIGTRAVLLTVKQLPLTTILASWPRSTDEQIVIIPVRFARRWSAARRRGLS